MSREAEAPIIILDANASDVAAANATWYSIDDCDRVVFDIAITGTANATIDFDYMQSGNVSSNNTINSNNSLIVTDPVGNVRAYSNNTSAGERVVVQMRRIYFRD